MEGVQLRTLAEATIVLAAVGVLVALFLPWFDAALVAPSRDTKDFDFTGWEAFRSADVMLVALAAAAAASVAAARLLSTRLAYAAAVWAGWIAVVVVAYSYYRPTFLGGERVYPGPPAEGFFLALFSAGAMAGAGLVGLLAPRPPADAAEATEATD